LDTHKYESIHVEIRKELNNVQGGQIFDDAFCGGGDTNEGLYSTAVPIQASAIAQIKAAIFMGDPRYIYGLPYDVGTCTAQGVRLYPLLLTSRPHFSPNLLTDTTQLQFAPRPAGFTCPSASQIQSYCDASDPYCCSGDDPATHQGYGTEYGQAALNFIESQLD
jgi:acetylxylan esterase